MKRALMFVCALAFAGMASAVTINWSDIEHEVYSTTTSTTDSNGSAHSIVVNPTTLSSAASFVACATITISNFTYSSTSTVVPALATLSGTSTNGSLFVGLRTGSDTSASVRHYESSSTSGYGTDTGLTLADGTWQIVYSYDAETQTVTAYISDGTSTYVGTSTGVTLTSLTVGGYTNSYSSLGYLDSYADYTAETTVV